MKINTKTIYFENLNGLRFIAFFSVFIGHAFVFTNFKIKSHVSNLIVSHFFLHGDLGVNFFFVLSGFLITFLLLKEKTDKGTISLRKFYMRRILRIWPVYFLTVFLGFFLIPFVFQKINHAALPFEINIPPDKLVWYVCFLVNFDMIFHGINYLMLVVLWSVSVEEQYYLIWPLINKITSKYVFAIVLGLLLILSYYYRWLYYYDTSIIKYSTFSVMNDLVIGSTIALCSFKSKQFKRIFIEMKKWKIYSLYILFIVCIPMKGFIYYFSESTDQFLVSLEPLIFSFFFAFIILEQNYARNSFFKISKIKAFSYLGTISYGLYCYHMIFIFLTALFFNLVFKKYIETSFLLFIFQTILSLSLTIFFSHISYRFFEKRFLKIKDRYTP